MNRYRRSFGLVFLLFLPVIAVLALTACGGGGGGGGGPNTHTISVSGGEGGQRGAVEIVLDTSGSVAGVTGLPAPGIQQLILYGYTDIDASAGSGNHGGMGGTYVF